VPLPKSHALVLSAGLVLAAACGREHPLSTQLKERLASVFHDEPSPDELRVALLHQLRVGSGTTTAFPSRQTIDDFYAAHAYRLVWSGSGGEPTPAAVTLIAALRRAAEHGLNPEDYAASRLEALEKELRGNGSAQRLADFELLATVGCFRYASDLATGRVHPDEVKSEWKPEAPELDIGKPLDDALAGNDLAPYLESLAPQHPGYARLRQALAKLREIEAAGGWSSIPAGRKMKSGSTDPRVAQLRQRLGVAPGARFDAALSQAVRRFQELHGIDPDGVVSDATLAELNRPVADRIRQVELNLERWRWIPRTLGDPHVLVNIPGFDLVLSQNGATVWHTRVVAGKAFTPTPLFSDRIVAIVVHPPWNVPESIAVNEYLPELRKNHDALERHGLHLLEGSGDKAREVNPRRVDWDRVSEDKFPYRLRQDPGAENPLGQVKFDLTNDFQIYLHDTPGGHAFSRTERDLSHGCIRVENALELANRIVNDDEKSKILQALDEPEEKRIQLASKVPVHIFYWTAWADEAGELHFGPDVYDFDAPQRQALDRAGPKKP
jgi:murein L,D-transpeptidase YcbB/YkuD